MTPQLKKLFLYLLPLGFIPYILLCFYNNPNADDFVFGFLGKKEDFWNQWWIQYSTWSGRYTSNFFVLAGPLKWGSFRLYKFIPLIMIILHWFSMKFLIKNLVGSALSKLELHLCTYLLVFLFIYQMPIISEGLYWYTGAVTYLLGCIFATFYLGLLARFWQGKFLLKSKFFHLALVTILIFITIGFNEVLMLMMNAFVVILLLTLIRNELENKWIAGYLILVTIAASCIIFFAPGNTVREARFEHNHDLVGSFLFSAAQTFRFFGTWVLSAPLWILSFAYYFLHHRLVQKITLFKESFYINVYTSTNLLFIIIFLSAFPAYWSTGILGQHRTLNVAYYFFIILWFMNLTVWFNWMETRISQIRLPNKTVMVILFTILIACFLFVKNGFYTASDILSGRAAHFDNEMHKRYVLMKSDADTIQFTPIHNPPKGLSFYEVTKDPKDWLNSCWVSYFGREGEVIVVRKE